MNSHMCLQWCRDTAVDGYPDDYKTAKHASEWLVDRASESAYSDEDIEIVAKARVWATSYLDKFTGFKPVI